MKRTWYKIIFWLIKKISIGLLTGLVSLNNQNARFNSLLLIYILMNTATTFIFRIIGHVFVKMKNS